VTAATAAWPEGRRDVSVVVITGSESTGKTTLARDLARHIGTAWVPEFARAYGDAQAVRGRALEAGDVEPIARGHIDWANGALAGARGLLVLDTDLVSTVVYARHYYGGCPAWIEEAALERRGDLYLLCDVDVPWLPDPRRDRPHLREQLHSEFVAVLEALGARYVTVRGSWEARRAVSVASVGALRHGGGEGRAAPNAD
jgi:NadR type nicotinamide-nucleotide adenylyltransferase